MLDLSVNLKVSITSFLYSVPVFLYSVPENS